MLSQGGVSEAVELFDDGLGETFEGESFVMPWEVRRSCIGKPQGKVLISSTISHGSRTVDVDRIGVFNRLWNKFACAFSSKVISPNRHFIPSVRRHLQPAAMENVAQRVRTSRQA